MKTTAAAAILFLAPIFLTFGLKPTLVVGGTGGVGSYSFSPSPSRPYTDAGLSESFGWRQGLGPGSYVSIGSQASFAAYLTSLQGSLDSESLDGELGLPAGPNSLIFGAGFKSSLHNQSGYGSYVLPYWTGEYRFRRNAKGLQPSLTYGGRYVVQQLGSDNHFVEALGLKLDRSSTVRFDGYLGLDTSWELWPQQHLFDSSGATTSALRQDYLLDLSAGAQGLVGYTLDWQAGVSAGLRLSTANEYLGAVSQLAEGSQTRFTQKGSGSLTWTPTRTFSATLSAQVQNDAYLSRKALDSKGVPSGTNLDVFSAAGAAAGSWALSGNTYLVITGQAARTFSNDPSFPQWSYELTGGVQYSF